MARQTHRRPNGCTGMPAKAVQVHMANMSCDAAMLWCCLNKQLAGFGQSACKQRDSCGRKWSRGGGVWGIPPSKRGRAGWRQHVASSINGRLFKIKFACNGFLIRLTKLRIRRMCPRRSRRRRRSLPLPTHTRALSLSLLHSLWRFSSLNFFLPNNLYECVFSFSGFFEF